MPTPHRRPGRRRDERGQALSVFVGTVTAALLLTAGLVVDGGAQSTATRRCEQVAAQAARAATDAGTVARVGGGGPDPTAMLAAARRVLDGSGVHGSVTVSGGAVHVTTRTATETVFLSLMGVTTLSSRGEAEAILLGSGGGGAAGGTP